MSKIGLYFGSFNPVHNGHIAIANYCAEELGLDEVWFVLAKQNPFKSDKEYAPFELRKLMINQAIVSNPKLSVCDIENDLPVPSYTYLTLRALKERFEKVDFCIIMGADSLSSLSTWSHAYEIIENEIIAIPRFGEKEISQQKSVLENLVGHELNIRLATETPLNSLSSTFIRNSIANNKAIVGYVPNEVANIIKQEKLYQNK